MHQYLCYSSYKTRNGKRERRVEREEYVKNILQTWIDFIRLKLLPLSYYHYTE